MEKIMNEQENITFVRQCYDDFLKGDIPHLLGACAEDIEWELPSMENISFSGKRHGRDRVGEFFQSMSEMQSAQQFEPSEFVAQGNKVMVTGHYAWSIKATGNQFESDWVHVFTVRDGRVTHFREFFDSHLAEAAYRPHGTAIGSDAARQSGADHPSLH
jgi:ketosteroid isomerase-like protein